MYKRQPKPKLGQTEHECLAETFLFLIGQPKSAIAAIEYPYNTRLFYLGEEKAEGFVANRLNLILDNSEKIVQVYCGYLLHLSGGLRCYYVSYK